MSPLLSDINQNEKDLIPRYKEKAEEDCYDCCRFIMIAACCLFAQYTSFLLEKAARPVTTSCKGSLAGLTF
jgi:hypothetical protein